MAEGDPKLGQKDSWRGDPITLCTPEDEVPTLYHTDTSYYSQVNKHCPCISFNDSRRSAESAPITCK